MQRKGAHPMFIRSGVISLLFGAAIGALSAAQPASAQVTIGYCHDRAQRAADAERSRLTQAVPPSLPSQPLGGLPPATLGGPPITTAPGQPRNSLARTDTLVEQVYRRTFEDCVSRR